MQRLWLSCSRRLRVDRYEICTTGAILQASRVRPLPTVASFRSESTFANADSRGGDFHESIAKGNDQTEWGEEEWVDEKTGKYVIYKRNRVRRAGSLSNIAEVKSPRSHATLPEICVLGRTNAGKSSLINHLLGHENIARASSRAGKTTAVDLFLVNNKLVLADLPGYGFKGPRGHLHKRWDRVWWPLTAAYLRHSGVKAALLLLDVRAPPSEDDVFVMEELRAANIPSLLILTKDDRINNRVEQKGHGVRTDEKGRPVVEARVARAVNDHAARAWLANRVRSALEWPRHLPHLHYSIHDATARRKLRRWMASMTEAEGRQGVMEVLESAWGGRVWVGSEQGSVRLPEAGEEWQLEKWGTGGLDDPAPDAKMDSAASA